MSVVNLEPHHRLEVISLHLAEEAERMEPNTQDPTRVGLPTEVEVLVEVFHSLLEPTGSAS
jgi:hypothetical protein